MFAEGISESHTCIVIPGVVAFNNKPMRVQCLQRQYTISKDKGSFKLFFVLYRKVELLSPWEAQKGTLRGSRGSELSRN